MYRPDALPATQPTVSKHWRLPTYIHTHLYSAKNRENEVRLAVSSKTRWQYCNFSYAQHHFQFRYSCFTAKISTSFTSTQTIDQSCISTVVQVIKSLQDPLEVGNNLPGINDNVRNEAWNRNVFRRWRKVDRYHVVRQTVADGGSGNRSAEIILLQSFAHK